MVWGFEEESRWVDLVLGYTFGDWFDACNAFAFLGRQLVGLV